ncbi:hypothetical protein LCM4577_00860 [Mesorhizobium sp. LCM 4577]|uniref:SDH family Clp fold serine proteinase n=1 Tax=Mesorhizobium sp. LCM 4577 TaxID=1848288 RepID=UPI0008D9BDAF|nr:hypothetical protein [Mesorhizobium sp. LCM 4577]OHV70761.1 hypothetical protein LCM4577_00860 [Mesorhizobium sp. LCM 4577]
MTEAELSDIPLDDLVHELGRRVGEEENADIYLYFGDIDDEGFRQLHSKSREGRHSRAILILTTNGGDASVAYRIARQFHQRYERFTIYVPNYCRSAGTILALGAHDLIMNSDALLGPIDPQLRKRDEICTTESALSSRATLNALGEMAYGVFEPMVVNLITKSEAGLSFELSSQVCADFTSRLMSGLVSKLDPTVFGRHKRAIDTAIEYGKRLAEVSGNAPQEAVEQLATAYPDCRFAIDFAEAAKLFRNVSEPSELLRMFAAAEQIEDDVDPHEQAADESYDGAQSDDEEDQPAEDQGPTYH